MVRALSLLLPGVQALADLNMVDEARFAAAPDAAATASAPDSGAAESHARAADTADAMDVDVPDTELPAGPATEAAGATQFEDAGMAGVLSAGDSLATATEQSQAAPSQLQRVIEHVRACRAPFTSQPPVLPLLLGHAC